MTGSSEEAADRPEERRQAWAWREVAAQAKLALEQAARAMEKTNELAAGLVAHERQCTERWLASREASQRVDSQLTAQDAAASEHRRVVYEKFDGVNGKLVAVLLTVAGTLVVAVASLFFYITVHR